MRDLDYTAEQARKRATKQKGGATLIEALKNIKERAEIGSRQTSFDPLDEGVVRDLRARGFEVEYMAGGNDACHVVRW